MKRSRSKMTKTDKDVTSSSRRLQRRLEKHNSDAGAEEELPRPQRDADAKLSTAHERVPGGFAYLREVAESAPPSVHTTGTSHVASATVPSTTTTMVPAALPIDDADAVFVSPSKQRSVTRGFSHLRESVSFLLPRLRSSVDTASSSRKSVVLPLPSPPPASVSHSSPYSSQSQPANRAEPHSSSSRHHRYRDNYKNHSGSNQSFLTTHSAMEPINSTGSFGGVISSRGSPRSSQATDSRCSVSKSTLAPLDLSPILKEETRRRRRRGCNGNRHGEGKEDAGVGTSRRLLRSNKSPIDLPAAVLHSTLTERPSRGKALEELHDSLSRYSRAAMFALFTLFMLSIWGMVSAPLVMRQNSPEDAFVRHYVDSVSELQFIYEVPYLSLSAIETRQLYLRVLSETLERLERFASYNQPSSDPDAQALYYKRMIRAYLTVRHRARLYARSRRRSRLHQYILDPLHDAWFYGILRHGFQATLRDLFWEPSFSRVWTRVRDTAICLRQDERMPCPTLAYLQEQLQEQQEQHNGAGKVDSVVAGDEVAWGLSSSPLERDEELRRLKRIMDYVSENCRQSSREYNHVYTGNEPGAFLL